MLSATLSASSGLSISTPISVLMATERGSRFSEPMNTRWRSTTNVFACRLALADPNARLSSRGGRTAAAKLEELDAALQQARAVLGIAGVDDRHVVGRLGIRENAHARAAGREIAQPAGRLLPRHEIRRT